MKRHFCSIWLSSTNMRDGVCEELLVSLAPQPLTGKLTSGCLSLGPDTHYFNKIHEVHF